MEWPLVSAAQHTTAHEGMPAARRRRSAEQKERGPKLGPMPTEVEGIARLLSRSTGESQRLRAIHPGSLHGSTRNAGLTPPYKSLSASHTNHCQHGSHTSHCQPPIQVTASLAPQTGWVGSLMDSMDWDSLQDNLQDLG